MTSKQPDKPRHRRGIAAMSPEQRRAICKLGGRKTAKRYGKAHMSKIGKNGRRKRTRMERQRKVAENMPAVGGGAETFYSGKWKWIEKQGNQQ